MNVSELKAKLDGVAEMLRAQPDPPKDPNAPEGGPGRVSEKAIALLGLEIGAELLLDIKRIADAAERIADKATGVVRATGG